MKNLMICNPHWIRGICGGSAYRVLVGKAEKKKKRAQLGRLRHKGEDNIKMDKAIYDGKGVDWIHLVHDIDNR